jgi:amidase
MTRNPYALDRDTGGSSSGTGSAVAANLAILGLGEDTGGSIRLPSSYCGLVGLRATPGLISGSGLCPLIETQDTPGPMTRTVKDAALMMDVLVGFDAADPYTSVAVLAGPPSGGSYAANLDSNKTLILTSRIGILRSAFGDSKDPDCAAVTSVIESAFNTLAASGTTFIDIEIPNLAHYLSFTPTYLCESRSQIDAYFSTTSPPILTTCATIHASSLAHPALQLFADIATGFETPTSDPQFAQRLLDRDALQNLVIAVMATHNLDAIAFPDSKIPAPLHADVDRWGSFDYPTNTLLASQARMPAISVPAGLTEGGLPVGLELVGLHYREQKLLELAYGIEGLVQGRKAPQL